LTAVDAAVEQPWLAQLPAIQVLREVWRAQYIKGPSRNKRIARIESNEG
jgi:hypothetical protein